MDVDCAAYELWPAGSPLPAGGQAWMKSEWECSVAPLAAELGVRVTRATLMTRTRKAHEAVAYARSEGLRDAMHEAVYAAYWQEGQDIGRIDVLVEIGGGIGLDRAGLKVALDVDQWTARVDQDLHAAAQLRLNGVPAYVRVSDEGKAGLRVGLQRYEELRAWMNHDDV